LLFLHKLFYLIISQGVILGSLNVSAVESANLTPEFSRLRVGNGCYNSTATLMPNQLSIKARLAIRLQRFVSGCFWWATPLL